MFSNIVGLNSDLNLHLRYSVIIVKRKAAVSIKLVVNNL